MKLNEYQRKAKETLEPNCNNIYYLTIGLAGESGEVAEKIKKGIRNNGGKLDVDAIVKELGDVLWYIAILADFLEVSLEEVAGINIAKLADRKKRGVIKSEGDDR